MRSCVVLLPVSSLPSEYGIGCFSKEAYEFVDKLSEAGQGYWQILPLGPTSYGDSPYQSFSTYAGNPYFVDLEELMKLGLIKEAELKKFNFGKNTKKIDYEKIYNSRFKALRIAFDNAKKLTTADYVGTNIIMDKGEGIIYAIGQFFTEGGAQFVSDDGSKADGYINSDASVKTAEYLNEFIKNGYANLDPVKDEFLNGKAATLLGGSWNIADLEKSNLNWGVSYFPVADDGKAASPTGDWAAAITKDSKNPDAAGKFLQWAMNSDNIASYASAVAKPASRTSSYDKMEGWDSGARALMKWQLQNTGVSRPRTPSYSVLSTDFSTAMLNIFSGSNAKDELDNVAKNFDENYEMYYKK